MHILEIVAIPAAGILIMEIIGFGLFRRRKLSNAQGSGGAAGFAAVMGIIVARDDKKLLALSEFLSDAGFGRLPATLTIDAIYILLAVAISYLLWVVLSKFFAGKRISL